MSKIVVLVPAYNEADSIASTIRSLLSQTAAISDIVIIPNNCSDNTAAIARSFPVTVHEMEVNPDRKAGAMNEGWSLYCDDADYVFTMDADTVLEPSTIKSLLTTMNSSTDLAGVCARYFAAPGKGIVWNLQRLEYVRADDNRHLRDWKVQVASGAAVMYRNSALKEVMAERNRPAPWDATSMIEDYGLTLDLKELGYSVIASTMAKVHTETPQTIKELWVQRLRWGRGGIDECRRRGWNPATRRDIVSYGIFGLSMGLRLLWISVLAFIIITGLPYAMSIVGLCLLFVMWLDRFSSTFGLTNRTWADRVLVHTLVVEDLYGFFLEACTLAALVMSFASVAQEWR